MLKQMYDRYKLTDEEFDVLYKKFNKLVSFQAWQLLNRNTHNNHGADFDDINQDIMIALIKSGVYYKRQTYIEECLELLKVYSDGIKVKKLIDLWENRRKHGANKQKFGEKQEKELDSLVNKIIPADKRPNPKGTLTIDKKFETYCKQITWNQLKTLGKKITKERSIRNGSVSLSEFDHVSGYSEGCHDD